MREKSLNIFRPSPLPSKDIPLGARSVGHYIVKPGFAAQPLVKHFIQVFWGIAGSGAIVMGGLEKRLAPGKLAIYLPGMEHRFYALEEQWEFRWWTMDGALAVPIVSSFGFASPDLYEAGPAPYHLFKQLESAVSENTPRGERKASALAYALLAAASGGSKLDKQHKDSKTREAIEIIHRDWMDPGLCVSSLAEQLRLDRSAFSRRFHSTMGVSPVNYISSLRIQNALSLLKNTRKPIAAIALSCGWSDPNYFSRCVRKASGLSPEDFRKT